MHHASAHLASQASGAAPSASASGHTSSNAPRQKINAIAGPQVRPSPKKKPVEADDEADEEELTEIIRN